MENKESLEELINTIRGAELTQEVVEWMDSISSPEQKLIENLISTFNKVKAQDVELSNKILDVLVLLDERCFDIVNPQIVENADFGSALVEYVKTVELENFNGNCLTLIVKFFDAGVFDDQIDDAFVTRLFDFLAIINHEKAFLDILVVLLRISLFDRYEKRSPVVASAQTHPNRRFFSEMLAQLTNKMTPTNEGYVFEFIRQFHNKSKTPLFYINDMKIMVDILIRALENNIMDIAKGDQIVNTLESIMNTNDYQECKHKGQYLKNLIKELEQLDDVPEENIDLVHTLLELIK